MEEESEDHLSLRREEIVALSSIYEELQLNADGLSGTVLIPIEPDKPVPIACGEREGTVKFLPGIEFTFSTSTGYPETEPPSVSLKCIWLSDERLQSLREDIISLIWMSTNDLCLFDLVDEISERSKSVFGIEFLDISEQVFDELVTFSERQQTKIFEQGVYYCEVCLENKKGVDSFKLPRCGHIFCKVHIFH
jgi:E3 ubiquitin-protein ligase RNF14